MGKQLTILVETVKEQPPLYGAYSTASARAGRLTEAVLARKAYEHPPRPEPRELDLRA